MESLHQTGRCENDRAAGIERPDVHRGAIIVDLPKYRPEASV